MSALDDLIASHNAEHHAVKRANWSLHEERLGACAVLFGCPVQILQDALYQVSIECNVHPDHILHCAYELASTVQGLQAKGNH